jgi:hypothetical protein
MLVSHRRVLLLGALSLAVASVASVTAMYRADPSIGLRTGGSPEAQVLDLQPGAPPSTDASSTTAPTLVPSTTAAAAPGSNPATTAPGGEPAGCVPGTFVEQHQSCRWKPVTITGRVTDAAGTPLPGICVHALMPPGISPARTDAQGRYRMEAPQGGLLLSAEACSDTRPEFGWLPAGVQAPSLEPGTSGGAGDIVLTERGGVYGRVVDPAGNPLAGICLGGGPASDADGRFATGPLTPGRHGIGALGGGTGPCPTVALSLEQIPVDVESGRWAGPVTVIAHPKVG